jgi:hypothetical protein
MPGEDVPEPADRIVIGAPLWIRSNPKLPSLCVDICALTCDNPEGSKVFLHRKSATMTGYHY